MNRVIWLYWEGAMPGYIALCCRTVRAHNARVELLDRAGFESLFHNDRDLAIDSLSLLHKSDFIRAYLLKHFGGLYLDADCVVLRDLTPVFECAEKYGFAGYRQPPGYVSNNLMASIPGGTVINDHYARVCAAIRNGMPLGWLDVGSVPLEQAVSAHVDWYLLPTELVMPLPWHESERLIAWRSDAQHEADFQPDAFCYMLSNNTIKAQLGTRVLSYLPEADLLGDGYFLSFLFRKALGYGRSGPRADIANVTKSLDVPIMNQECSAVEGRGDRAAAAPPSIRNVFACLVHENLECVVDLVLNLRHLDPPSTVLLYNGSAEPQFLTGTFPFERFGVALHPSPRPMYLDRLHDFALDCMRYALVHLPFDTLTIVDSDQLAVRPGYSARLAAFLAEERGAGMLSNNTLREGPEVTHVSVKSAFAEIDLWRPFLERFPDWESKFVHRTFWPTTVFTEGAARALVTLCDRDAQIQEILRGTKIWATEELILPTLVALLGFRIAANPCSYDFVRYRTPYSIQQIDAAMCRRDVFWAHPIPRRHEDPLRRHIRGRFNDYSALAAQPAVPAAPGLFAMSLPTRVRMRKIEGWLEEAEAELLNRTIAHALSSLPEARAVVEVGSYCGRRTVVLGSVVQAVRPEVRLWSVDPHDGKFGSADRYITIESSPEKLKANIVAAGLADVVQIVQATATQVPWHEPIALLVIDGLHDYASVARDFHHFAPHLVANGYVAFHGYGSYFPGVAIFVDELLTVGEFHKVDAAGSMILLKKT
jgi:hypothetical protein